MGSARKHHYVPECYLKAWGRQSDNGRLIEIAERGGALRPRWTHPGGTGYAFNIYDIRELGADADYVEARLLAAIDMVGNRALEALRRGEVLATPERRTSFAVFLMALMLRPPGGLNVLFDKARQAWSDLPSKRAAAAEGRSEEDGDQLGAFIADLAYRLLTHSSVGTHIINMTWGTLTIPRRSPRLMTSDRPVLSTNGLGYEASELWFPLSPSTLFVAVANPRRLSWHRHQASRDWIARSVNEQIVGQADRWAYVTDPSQVSDAIALFGKNRRRTLGEKIVGPAKRQKGRRLTYSGI